MDCNGSVTITDGVNVLRKAAGLAVADCSYTKISGTDYYTPAGIIAGNPKCSERIVPVGQFCGDRYSDPQQVVSALGTITVYRFLYSVIEPVLPDPSRPAFKIWKGNPSAVAIDTLVVWEGNFDVPNGADNLYSFRVRSNDGVKVIIDNLAIINKWQDQDWRYYETRLLSQGRHNIRVPWYGKAGGDQLIEFEMQNRPLPNNDLGIIDDRLTSDQNDPSDTVVSWKSSDTNYFSATGNWQLDQNRNLFTDTPGSALTFRWKGTSLRVDIRGGPNARGFMGTYKNGVTGGLSYIQKQFPHLSDSWDSVPLATLDSGWHEYTLAATDDIRGTGGPLLVGSFHVENFISTPPACPAPVNVDCNANNVIIPLSCTCGPNQAANKPYPLCRCSTTDALESVHCNSSYTRGM